MDEVSRKPAPVPDPESQPYWDAAAKHLLKIPYCTNCSLFVFPPKPICPNCTKSHLEWTEVSGNGRLYSFAVMHESYMRGFDAPYVIAQVELDEQSGLRLTSNLIDCEVSDAVIGMPVTVAFEQRADGVSVPQFRPVAGS